MNKAGFAIGMFLPGLVLGVLLGRFTATSAPTAPPLATAATPVATIDSASLAESLKRVERNWTTAYYRDQRVGKTPEEVSASFEGDRATILLLDLNRWISQGYERDRRESDEESRRGGSYDYSITPRRMQIGRWIDEIEEEQKRRYGAALKRLGEAAQKKPH